MLFLGCQMYRFYPKNDLIVEGCHAIYPVGGTRNRSLWNFSTLSASRKLPSFFFHGTVSLTNQAGWRGRILAERGRSPSAAPAARQKDLVFSGVGSPGDPLRAGTARAPGAAARTVCQKHHPIFSKLFSKHAALLSPAARELKVEPACDTQPPELLNGSLAGSGTEIIIFRLIPVPNRKRSEALPWFSHSK